MGFLDKAKQQASSLANKAQEGINQGQAKLGDAQAKRHAKELLAELGAWEWAAAQGRESEVAAAEVARIRAELLAHEAEHGPIDPPNVAAEPQPETAAETAPEVGTVEPPAAEVAPSAVDPAAPQS
ncbi:MAG: hypothetical protein JST73_12990 [Actinobacteria bacterium]|nr:hypothetical protein [Actinomycetota bacterium]